MYKFFGAIASFLFLTTSAQAASLIPADSIGSVKVKEYSTKPNELQISTGGGDRAASSLGNWLVNNSDFLKPYGTEGSIALFDLEPGTYELEWQFYTSETDSSDLFLVWDGVELNELATGAIADVQQSRTRWRNEWTSTEIETTTGTLGLIALDTDDKTGTSIWKVRSIKQPTPTTIPEADLTFGFLLLGINFLRRLGK